MASKSPKEPSQEFVNAVTDGTTCVADCELCGRTIFQDNELEFFEDREGELEALREKQKENPDKYVGYTDRSVGIGNINGKQVVTNCVCNGLREFENWIWGHRHIIAAYVQERTRNRAESALRDEAEAEFLNESVEKTVIDRDKEFAKCQDCYGYFDKEAMDEHLLCIRCAKARKTEAERRREDPPKPDVFIDDDDRLPF